VACPIIPYFLNYLLNGTIFFCGGEGGDKVIQDKMRVLIFYSKFGWNISHSKKNSGRYYHKYTHIVM